MLRYFGHWDSHPYYNEFLNKDGERQHYEACSESDLETAKAFYHNREYIGSGYIMYHDGVENVYKKEHHFFGPVIDKRLTT